MTRLALKRAATAMGAPESQEKHLATKKRVVLGEISNLSNVIQVNQNLGSELEKAKCRPNKRPKKALTETLREDDTKGIDIDAKSDDPQMCSAYVSDIYEYLHNMEVSEISVFSLIFCVNRKWVGLI